MRGEGVAEGVRANLLGYASTHARLFYDGKYHHASEFRATIIQKERILLAGNIGALLHVELYAVARNATDWHETLPVTLAHHANISLAKEQVADA